MSLQADIEAAINRANAESGSDTPDWILAQYLMGCLFAFNQATNQRARWYGQPGLTNSAGIEEGRGEEGGEK